jgi:hypothetical protein
MALVEAEAARRAQLKKSKNPTRPKGKNAL